jgi:hypothetical protein
MKSTLYYDLVAQRAASVARIADMRHKVSATTGSVRECWAGMLRQYIDAMPALDAQIEYASRSAA